MSLLKLATIGTSWITDSFIDAARKSGKFELFAVYSRQMQKAEEFRLKHGAPFAFDTLEGLACSGADVVYIASPNSVHFEQAVFFMQKGIHVICEKPAAVKKNELSLVFETARGNGVYFLEALYHIHTPGFNAIKQNIGAVAPVRSAFISYCQYSSKYGAFLSGALPNSFNPAFGGGAKFDLGVYPVSAAAALFGKPVGVQYSPVLLSGNINIAGAYILQYDGFNVSITFSKAAEDASRSQIIGEAGGISFGRPHELKQNIILTLRDGSARDISAGQHENHLTHEAEAFADIINGNNDSRYQELIEISKITNGILTFAAD